MAQQVIGHVGIAAGGGGEQFAGPRRIAVLAESQQGGGEGPLGRGVVLILLEQPPQIVVAIELQQPVGQQIADALVVAGVQPKHVPGVRHRLIATAEKPETLGHAFAGRM